MEVLLEVGGGGNGSCGGESLRGGLGEVARWSEVKFATRSLSGAPQP